MLAAHPKYATMRDQESVDFEFQRRREKTARRRREILGMTRAEADLGGAVSFGTLEDENQRLKLALHRAADESRKNRVMRVRLEEELCHADGKVEMLLAEFNQAPGKR